MAVAQQLRSNPFLRVDSTNFSEITTINTQNSLLIRDDEMNNIKLQYMKHIHFDQFSKVSYGKSIFFMSFIFEATLNISSAVVSFIDISSNPQEVIREA